MTFILMIIGFVVLLLALSVLGAWIVGRNP